MHFRLMAQILALAAVILAAGMLVPSLLGLIWGEREAALALASGSAVGLLVAALLAIFGGVRPRNENLLHREAFLAVTLTWLMACFVSGVPFWVSGHFGGFTSSMFEAFSGFTTTGATILADIEAVPSSLLLWRAATQWLGGGGIVLLGVAILPLIGVGGLELYRKEVSGPTTTKLQPRVRETARLLWRVYLLLTGAQILLLVIAGVGLFDAVSHALTTVSTGGFSTKNASVAAFDDTIIEGIFIVFMLAGGTAFSLHFAAMARGPGVYLRDMEFKVYIAVVIGSMLLIASALWLNSIYDATGSIRYALFQVASIITSTGYANADFEAWRAVHALPAFTLLVLMVSGGCAGSTAGGVKIIRFWMALQQSAQELFRQIHPRAVTRLKLGGIAVPTVVQSSLMGFLMLYAMLFLLGSLALSLLGLDYVSATSASVSALSNMGPALGTLGPFDNYADLPAAGKWILMVMMVVGRLEIYTVLVLLLPEYWRR